MIINNLKINGIINPIGFKYERLMASWQISDTRSKHQKKVRIEVSREESFAQLVHQVDGCDLKSIGTTLNMTLTPYTRYYWRVKVTGDGGDAGSSEPAFFETGRMDVPWTASWVGPAEEDGFHPALIKEFQVPKAVRQARLYICGLGVYEAYLNDKRVGEEHLAPFINDYKASLQYQTYELPQLVAGMNRIEIDLGKGWYIGRFGLEGKSENFGKRMAAIAEIHIDYADGTRDMIPTDRTWLYKGSDVQDSGIYDGEIFNRLLWKDKENRLKPVALLETDTALKALLTERYSLPVLVKEAINPKQLINTPAGEWVLDMGQNFAGYVMFKARLPEGTKIVLDFGEMLQDGNFFNGNYESANKGFTYISDGREELVRPHFTYYGLRYVRISGWPGELNPQDFIGMVVYSDLERTGYIETSDSKINRLYENCLWSQKSNFLDMPTDCPQRAERLGWTGDAQVFAATACYNMDARAFYGKFLRDLRSEQVRMNGGVPNYIPALDSRVGVSSVWADAATIIPEQLYQSYGSLEDMADYYPLMKGWVDYVARENEKNDTGYLFTSGFHFGDWLAQDGITPNSFKGGTDDGFIASVYYFNSAKLTARMAQRLTAIDPSYEGDARDYDSLAENIRLALLAEYFSANGRLCIDTQAAYIIALKFGVYVDKARLIEQFKTRLKKDCYEIKCGFVGAPLLCMTLCEHGMEDLAYHFLFKEGFPSWLYSVNLGATTIWERWNSVLEDGRMNPIGMNSLNHYAYGSVVEFMYAHVAGIRPLAPAFSRVLIKPAVSMRFRWVRASYLSASGRYTVAWKIEEDGRVIADLSIPFGCEAEVQLPGYEPALMVLESGDYHFDYMPAVDFRKIYSAATRLEALRQDEEAKAILGEEMPLTLRFMAGEDKEKLALSLGELKYMTYMGFRPEAVERAIEKISALSRY